MDNKDIKPDVKSVLKAAALLDITEYEFFHLAYWHWHGGWASEANLEPHFIGYMFRERVPTWVRHFSRDVEERDEQGVLDPRALGVKKLPQSRQMVSAGMRYCVVLGVVLFTLIVFAEVAAELMRLGEECMFPPCY